MVWQWVGWPLLCGVQSGAFTTLGLHRPEQGVRGPFTGANPDPVEVGGCAALGPQAFAPRVHFPTVLPPVHL